jgi:hypothetical protein
MEHTRFVGLDIHKERISIAVAASGRSVAVEYLGEIANDPGAISKLCDRLGTPPKLMPPLRSTLRRFIRSSACTTSFFVQYCLSLSETQSCWQLISNRAMLLPYARGL